MASKLIKIRERKIRHFALFFFLSLCSACSLIDTSPDISFELKFKKNTKIAYGENISTCSLVDFVDTYKVEDKNINSKENKIYVSNLEVNCGTINTKKLGKQTIVYDLNGNKTSLDVTIKDLTAPKIIVQKSFEIEAGETFNVLDKLQVKDNLDKEKNIKLKVTGEIDKNKAGTYTQTITATDKSKNKSTKKITVIVKEKPKEENTNNQNENNPSNNNAGNTGSNKPTEDTVKPPESIIEAYTKKFLFSDGYDFQSAPQACQKEAMEAFSNGRGASCTNLFDENGQPIGQLLTVN